MVSIARDARAWLTKRFGPPRGEPALVTVQSEGQRLESDVGWSIGNASTVVEDPPTIVMAQATGFTLLPDPPDRPRTLARWVFYLEWTKGLAPWLREGLSDLAAASLVAEAHPDQFDGTVVGLLPDTTAGGAPSLPEPADLLDMDAKKARRVSRDCLVLLSAATDGGEPALVRALLDAPPATEADMALLVAKARAHAARFPSDEQLERALAAKPRATSTTAVVEAATARDRSDHAAVEAALVRAFDTGPAEARRLAVFGLGRLGARPEIVLHALGSSSFHMRVTAVAAAARARPGDKAIARSLLELAKEGSLEEVPGRLLRPIELFDGLMGYSDETPLGPEELSLGTTPRVPRYRDIERREKWLGGER